MTITPRQKELLVSLVVIGMGVFFLWQARMIENFENDPVGPELVPTILSLLMIGLGGLSVVNGLIFSKPDGASRIKVSIPALLWIGAVTGFGIIYFFLFLAVGYLLATIVTLGVVLVVFGVRHPAQVLLISVLGGAAYYFIFIRLMRVYDPPGSLIDLSTFLTF